MARDDEVRINSGITAREVRLIDTNGDQLGVLPVAQAQAIADDRKLDLVEVAGTAQPPVCRIMDFHKFRYEQRKKTQESKKKTVATALKEVKIRSRTEAHDIAFKTKHILRFLEQGHRVKVSVFFKGREITRPQLGRVMLDRVLESISDVASPEGEPRMEGRHMSVVVVPAKAHSGGA
ncbi:MAG: translation initiation factor IF-3 [Candidatus Binatia bacterium]